MRPSLLVVGLLLGCGDNRPARFAGDAGGTDTALDAGSSDSALSDAVLSDAALSDAAPDAPIDAPVMDSCPHRTAPPGVPQDTIPPEATIVGSVTVVTQADVDALAGIRYITGDLNFGDVNGAIPLTAITLPDLEVIGGTLDAREITRPYGLLDDLHLPRLETVGGGVVAYRQPPIGQPDTMLMTSCDTPRLESVGASLTLITTHVDLSCLATAAAVDVGGAASDVFSLPRLSAVSTSPTGTVNLAVDAVAIDLPELTTANALFLVDMNRLATMSAPKLADASLRIETLPALTSVTIGHSSHLAYISIVGVPLLRDLDFLAGTAHIDSVYINAAPALRSIAGLTNTQIDGLWLVAPVDDLTPIQNAAVTGDLTIFGTNATSLRMPNVHELCAGCTLQISNNSRLTMLDMPGLTKIDSWGDDFASEISYNPNLPTCQAQAIADRVLANSPGLVFNVTNNGSGTCPAMRRTRVRNGASSSRSDHRRFPVTLATPIE